MDGRQIGCVFHFLHPSIGLKYLFKKKNENIETLFKSYRTRIPVLSFRIFCDTVNMGIHLMGQAWKSWLSGMQSQI